MEKVVRKRSLHDLDTLSARRYWLSRAPEERIAAVEFLRRQYHGEYPTQRTFTSFFGLFSTHTVRVDLVTGIDGVEWSAARDSSSTFRDGDLEIPVIGIEQLRQNKRATGRAQDLADLEALGEV